MTFDEWWSNQPTLKGLNREQAEMVWNEVIDLCALECEATGAYDDEIDMAHSCASSLRFMKTNGE